MKILLKTSSFLLILCMLALACCACAKKTPSGPVSPTEPETPETPSCKPEIAETFPGETIRFYVCGGDHSPTSHVRSLVLTENADPEEEITAAIKRRNEKVEEELGVKIELAGSDGSTLGLMLKSPLLAHVLDCDVIALYQYFDIGLALDAPGTFYNYLDMPEGKSYIDPDAPYWNRSIFDAASLNGAAWAITGDLCLGSVDLIQVSFVNAALWEEFKEQIKHFESNPEGLDSVYDLVKKGYWTLDLWMELAKTGYKDLNNNGTRDYKDRAGVMTYNNVQPINFMADCFASGAHVVYSEKDASGKPSITMYSEHNLTFADKLYQLLCQSDAVTIPWIPATELDERNNLMDFFADGRVLATVNSLNCAADYLSDMKDDYYILPLPLLDRAQYNASSASLGYSTQIFDSVSQYAILKDAGDDRLPAITATMELMAYYAMTDVRPVIYDKALKGRYTANRADREMIDLIRAGIYGDFALIWCYKLGNLDWYFRQNYDLPANERATALKEEDKKLSDRLKKYLSDMSTVI